MVSLLFCVTAACGKPGAADAGEPEDIEAIVQAFYASEYEYEYEETHTFEKDGVTSGYVFEGQVSLEPYREHVKVHTFGDTASAYSEVTYEEEAGVISAKLVLTDGSVTTQTVQRKYPYGYEQDLVFSEQKEGVTDGTEVVIWHGECVADVGAAYGFEERLTTVVEQTYYVSKTDHTLIRLDTDLTELNRIMAAANAMSGGLSYEEAPDVAKTEEQQELVVMKIMKREQDR